MIDYDTYKKGFDAWETATADYIERWMKSPLMLAPVGFFLSQVLRAKGTHEKIVSAWWGAMGLATKHDQERALFALHKMESRLMDLEEKLERFERPLHADAE